MTPSKKQQTTTQPPTATQPTTPATPAPATAPKPQAEVVSKQQKAVMAFVAALGEQKITVKPEALIQDGKYILIRPWGPAPTIKIGPSGSYDIVEVKSYPKADLQTMVNAKALYDKAQARYAKKAATGTATAPVAAAPQPAPAKETPTTKKARQGKELEAAMA